MFLSKRVKCVSLAFGGVLVCCLALSVSAAQDVRLNDSWKYFNGNQTTAEMKTFNDAPWATVYIPHSMTLTAVGGSAPLGDCWYRKMFRASAYQGKKLFLEFQGGMQTVYVYLNSTLLTTHLGGYDPFALDITNNVTFSASDSNVIAVHLNNSAVSTFPPGRAGPDFQYFGGLYRDVYLYVADSLHITNPLVENIAGGGGIFVTYPSVSTSSATVQVKTHVRNEYLVTKSCVVTTTLLDSNGATVTANSTSATNITNGTATTFTQSLTVSNPHLWGPNSPYLYKVRSQVYDGARLADEQTTTIGIRTISFSKAMGFQINGVRMILRGGDRHQDYPYIGNAAPARLQYTDALRMKEYGFNFVRMSHYVQSREFVAGCDRLGIMGQMPVPGWQHSDAGATFTNNSVAVIQAMIRYYRNSPSIILWETAHNESSDGTAYVTAAQNAATAEYPGNQMYTVGEPTMTCSGDYGSGYAYNVIATSSQHGARTCISTTSKPMAFGEYGDWDFGGGANRCSRNSEANMTVLARNHYWSLNADRALTALQADAVWTAIDYNGPLVRSGALDWARLPKFSAYFYQSQRDPSVTILGANSGPMVFIMNWWTSTSPTRIRIFSNCDQVRLSLNGNIIATQSPDAAITDSNANLEHRPYTFNTSFTSGTLLAEGLIGGTVRATHTVMTPGTAAGVKVVIDQANLPPFQADGSDIAFVYGSIVDANGTLLQTSTANVTFTVTGGNARLIKTTEATTQTVTAEAGVATVLLRGGTVAGQIIVTGTASGTPGSDTVTAVAPPVTGTIDPFRPSASSAQAMAFVISQKGSVLSVQVPYAAVKELSAAKFTLCNAQGRLVGQWNLKKSSTRININSLPHGVYFGQISAGTYKYLQKIAR